MSGGFGKGGKWGKLRGRPYFVAFINELMSSRDELEAIHVVELRSYFIPKQPTRPPWRYSPRPHIFRITPYQVAESTLVGDLLRPSDDADLIQGADFGAEAAVHAEDFAVDDGAQHEEVEDLTAGFPDGGVAVFGLAFFVEAVDLGYLTGFVVAADEGYAVGVANGGRISWFSGYAVGLLYLPGLEAEKQCQRLQTKVAPIDKVAEEYVVLIAWDRRIALFLDA